MSPKIIVLCLILISSLTLVALHSVSARTPTPTKNISTPLSFLSPINQLDLPPYKELDRIKQINELELEPASSERVKTEERQLYSNRRLTSADTSVVHTVPFYSQFADISKTSWQKVGCGIASLGMLIDYYQPAVSIDTLLDEGINAGAYIDSAGWSHAGLINLAKKYGLTGASHGLAHLSMNEAFATLKDAVNQGPVMVSVHYTFLPTNPIPHLVVITGIDGDNVYYNDPAEASGNGNITVEKFQKAWKKRYIEIRPLS